MRFHLKSISLMCLLSCMLSSCSVVNNLRMMQANEGIEPIWQTPARDQLLHATYIGEKPYLNVLVNDTVELLFLVDTGASFTMLFDTPKVKGLAKERGYNLEVGGWGEGEDTKAYQSALSSINIANVGFKNVKVAYIPISTSPYYAREDEAIFDGVIGHDLMQHFAWTFDKKYHRIRMSALSPVALEGDTVLPISVFLSKLSVPAKVKFNDTYEVERDLIIDTGSRHYLKLSSVYPSDNEVELQSASVDAADFGLSGVTEHQRITLPGVSFDQMQLSRVKTNLIPSDDEDDWWVIGSALMNQFITIIDYHSNRFILRPYPNNHFRSLYNLAGLEIRKLRNGNFVVRYLSATLPAAKAGIKVGDEITSIDGIDSEQLSEEQWLEINAVPKTTKVCLKLMDCVSFSTEHIKGYSIP